MSGATAPALLARRRRRRRLAYGLFAFGASGLILVLAGTVLVLGSLGAVDDAASGFERQRAELLAMLQPAADALDGAATSATNAGTSLTSSADAAEQAATFTSRLAGSFEGLASLSAFEVFGTRPFAGLGEDFAQVGTDARTLSSDLLSTATALRTNVADTASVAADLRTLADRLDALQTSLGASAGEDVGNASLALGAARLVLLGLLLWLAIPAALCTWLGWRMTRRLGG